MSIAFNIRLWSSGEPTRLTIRDEMIESVEPAEVRGSIDELDFAAPAFWDLQTNGRNGLSFADPSIDSERVAWIVREHVKLGEARICPTLISATESATLTGLRAIARACREHPDVAAAVLGIHLEGPYLSSLDGYRGAHDAEVMRDPTWEEFERFQDAAEGAIAIVTLAPEREGAIDFIKRLSNSGVVVAIGHTAADLATIDRAVSAGAKLSTHLGNGIASTLPRHPNPIWNQAGDDRLYASFIADGDHVDASTLRVLLRAKGDDRSITISDMSPLAGTAPGVYGAWEVTPSGKVLVAGTPYLAGSCRDQFDALAFLTGVVGVPIDRAIRSTTINPARLLGRPEPKIEPGEPANLVRFRVVFDPSTRLNRVVRSRSIDDK